MPRIYEDRGIDLENTVNYSVFGLKISIYVRFCKESQPPQMKI